MRNRKDKRTDHQKEKKPSNTNIIAVLMQFFLLFIITVPRYASKNLLKLLFLTLYATAIFPEVSSGMSTLTRKEGRIPSRKDGRIPCGENPEQYLFGKGDPGMLVYIENALAGECTSASGVPKLFNQANTRAYAADYCAFFGMDVDHCQQISGSLKNPILLKTVNLSPKATGLKIVSEGRFCIASSDTTLVTAKLSFCVALALTNPESEQVMLVHINAENIQAFDDFLKGYSTQNPFLPIQSFIEGARSSGWTATLASGSSSNLDYMRTVLEDMGIQTFNTYYEQRWAIDSGPTGKAKNAFLNNGNLVIKKGRVKFLKCPQQFQNHIRTLPKKLKGKPLQLRPVENCQSHRKKPEVAPIEKKFEL